MFNNPINPQFCQTDVMVSAVKLKLTPRQNMIIYCLQNGWSLITQSQTSIVTCCSSKGEFTFNSSILFRLVNMGLIHQTNYQKQHFEYILTSQGQDFVPKKVPLDEWM